jgi:hypothetical protein
MSACCWRSEQGSGRVGHAASGVHGKVYEHRELLPMSVLRDGLERLTYPAVVESLE